MFHCLGNDSSQCSLCICNSIENSFRYCDPGLLACFWVRGAWGLNRQGFIVGNNVFLDIIYIKWVYNLTR